MILPDLNVLKITLLKTILGVWWCAFALTCLKRQGLLLIFLLKALGKKGGWMFITPSICKPGYATVSEEHHLKIRNKRRITSKWNILLLLTSVLNWSDGRKYTKRKTGKRWGYNSKKALKSGQNHHVYMSLAWG